MSAPTDGPRVAAAAVAVLLLCVIAACGRNDRSASPSSPPPAQNSMATAQRATSGETPVPPEVNPPGDIPDTQAFVEYVSPAGYSIKVPEGWARSVRGANVRFIDKFDGVSVTVAPISDTLASIKAAARAGSDFRAKEVVLPAGPAVEVAFKSNSEPDQVTEKKLRLVNVAVIFVHGAPHATLRVWAPLGADNVDQWNVIERSFRFH
jgi:hypothetical protein